MIMDRRSRSETSDELLSVGTLNKISPGDSIKIKLSIINNLNLGEESFQINK